MSFSRTVSPLALAAALGAGPAMADVTGAQVWQHWKDYATSVGYALSATETQTGASLELSDIVMSIEFPEGDGVVTIDIASMRLTDLSDGSVEIGMADYLPIKISAEGPDDESFAADIAYRQSGHSIIATGEQDALTFDYKADELIILLENVTVEGADEVPPDSFEFELVMSAVSGTQTSKIGATSYYDQTFKADKANHKLSFEMPEEEGGGTFSFDMLMRDVRLDTESSLPADVDMQMMGLALAAGMVGEGLFAFEEGESTISVQSPDGAFDAKTSSDGGELSYSMSSDGLAFDFGQEGFAVEAQVPDFPFPITFEMGAYGMGFLMPTVPSDEEQDFGLSFGLEDVSMSDVVWGLFDPAGALPRDPVTALIDLEGTMTLLADIFDPDQADALESGEIPAEPNTLKINEIVLSAVGAEATGEGAFTFDNTDTETFDGFPRPEGIANVRLEGGNALIDTLIGMGLLPQEQAMGARMMMGLFMVPESEDVLTSEIELNSDGHLLVNGQRMQ